MSDIRRTRVAATEGDLAVLAAEARSRGLPLNRMLGELVAERAQTLRSQHRPRLATFTAEFTIAGAMENGNPAARPLRP